jgi:hypothetical protein
MGTKTSFLLAVLTAINVVSVEGAQRIHHQLYQRKFAAVPAQKMFFRN